MMKTATLFSAVLLLLTTAIMGVAHGGLLYEASLRSGDYGGGWAVETLECPASCPFPTATANPLGIVNGPEGVTFTSTESDGRSNALVNWFIGDDRIAFKQQGTVSFWFKADRRAHVAGAIFGDNYGYENFCNGQGTFAAHTNRIENGEGIDDDQVQLTWTVWNEALSGYWASPTNPEPLLEYDRWYHVGYTWGGTENDFEIWIDGALVSAADWPSGAAFPWGMEQIGVPSGINFGLGSNHQRGCTIYTSTAGVTFADLRIWNEYRPQGDTTSEFALLSPPDSSSLTSPPSFAWSPGGYDAFLFVSVFPYGTGTYYPVKFWLLANSFSMPEAWWEVVAGSTPAYWVVIGVDTASWAWEVAGPRAFTKID